MTRFTSQVTKAMDNEHSVLRMSRGLLQYATGHQFVDA